MKYSTDTVTEGSLALLTETFRKIKDVSKNKLQEVS